MDKIVITICGGGSLGHVTAGVCGSQESVVVNILTNRPERWGESVCVSDPNGKKFIGRLNHVTADPAEIIPQSDIVYLCVPGYLIESNLRKIAPFMKPDCSVGACVSSSGFFFAAEKVLPNNVRLFGFQRVPYIARVTEYGKSASLLGYKPLLKLATKNIADSDVLKDQLSSLLLTPIELLPNYLDAALTNSNPILHPSRLYGLWHDWKPGVIYPKQALFYEEWDLFSAETLIACDEDFFAVHDKTAASPGGIPRLLDYYESSNADELARKLRSIPAFQKIPAPMVKTDGGYLPDWGNRYFLEDFPFGLKIIKDLAVKYQVEVPTVDKILAWADSMPVPWINKN
jgi:hypothetical protein